MYYWWRHTNSEVRFKKTDFFNEKYNFTPSFVNTKWYWKYISMYCLHTSGVYIISWLLSSSLFKFSSCCFDLSMIYHYLWTMKQMRSVFGTISIRVTHHSVMNSLRSVEPLTHFVNFFDRAEAQNVHYTIVDPICRTLVWGLNSIVAK